MGISIRCHYVQSIALLATALSTAMILLLSASPSVSAAPRNGFSVKLIHRDSPESPYYNASETPYERLHRMLRGSELRATQMIVDRPNYASPISEIINSFGLYFMNISVGTPPFPILAIVDSGSELTWTQCRPCDGPCLKQSAPLFDPSKSLSYQDVSCHSNACAMSHGTGTCDGEICRFRMNYGASGFFVVGNLARDTITLASTSGKPIMLNSTLFGCTHSSGDSSFLPAITSGIVGLGGDPMSLLSQMGDLAAGIFSYCLTPYFGGLQSSGWLNFGSNGVVSGPGTVATPLVYSFWYYITLEGITVSGNRIELERPSLGLSSSPGNIIIDSGSVLTFVPRGFYYNLESSVAALMKLKLVKDPPGGATLCYYTGTDDFEAPSLTVHFKGGADVRLTSTNMFMRASKNMVCFAFRPTMDGQPNVYGNLAQSNFLIGYDVRSGVVSFKPMDCSKI